MAGTGLTAPHRMSREQAAARALACIGVRFRLHGRDPAGGLDCIGLAAHVLGIAGVPSGYRLRSGLTRVLLWFQAAGFAFAAEASPGDLLLARTGPGSVHLLVETGAARVHADAGLGRVAGFSAACPWPVAAIVSAPWLDPSPLSPGGTAWPP